jgi:hypothetical protein
MNETTLRKMEHMCDPEKKAFKDALLTGWYSVTGDFVKIGDEWDRIAYWEKEKKDLLSLGELLQDRYLIARAKALPDERFFLRDMEIPWGTVHPNGRWIWAGNFRHARYLWKLARIGSRRR